MHLAAALYIPRICQSLLDDKLDLNHKSAWGSPLEFATASLAVFFNIEELFDDEVYGENWLLELDLGSDTASKNKVETLELLIGAGAAVTNSSSQLGTNLLDLSFVFAAMSYDLSASTNLMSLGVELGKENPDSFRTCMTQWQHQNSGRLNSKQCIRMMKDTLH